MYFFSEASRPALEPSDRLWSLQTGSGAFGPALEPTLTPIQCTPRALSPQATWPGPEADHSPHLVPQLRIIVLYFHSDLAFAGLRRDKFICAVT
jgi:hypothetical protein